MAITAGRSAVGNAPITTITAKNTIATVQIFSSKKSPQKI